MSVRSIADRILDAFSEIFALPPDRVGEIGVSVALPTFNVDDIKTIVRRARSSFQTQETLLDVPLPVYVIGDLHGNIFDLLRILLFARPPPKNRFLFLGDYVDRGQYSVEVIVLLFALLAKYPAHIFLLRGNHEFDRMNSLYGFKTDVLTLYADFGQEIYAQINNCFQFLPLAAVVGGEIFCVHGGISCQVTSFRQLRSVRRPIESYDSPVVSDLMWSDPAAETKDYEQSTRGNGSMFGSAAVKAFQKSLKVTTIIRAHQVVTLGVERFGSDDLYTVFSSSNYNPDVENRCGLIFFNSFGEMQAFSLPQLTQVPRESALLSGGLFEESEDKTGLPQSKPTVPLMCLIKSNSTDLSPAKGRANKTASVIGSALRASKSMEHLQSMKSMKMLPMVPASLMSNLSRP
jgi:protein phosphatase